jgi:hypothetical protein
MTARVSKARASKFPLRNSRKPIRCSKVGTRQKMGFTARSVVRNAIPCAWIFRSTPTNPRCRICSLVFWQTSGRCRRSSIVTTAISPGRGKGPAPRANARTWRPIISLRASRNLSRPRRITRKAYPGRSAKGAGKMGSFFIWVGRGRRRIPFVYRCN